MLHVLTVQRRLVFFGAFPLVFQNNHGFTISQTGLAFLGLFVGMLVGITTDLFWRRVYNRLVQRSEAQGGGSEPEFRLSATILGAFVVPIALFGKPLQIWMPVGIPLIVMVCRVRMDDVFFGK